MLDANALALLAARKNAPLAQAHVLSDCWAALKDAPSQVPYGWLRACACSTGCSAHRWCGCTCVGMVVVVVVAAAVVVAVGLRERAGNFLSTWVTHRCPLLTFLRLPLVFPRPPSSPVLVVAFGYLRLPPITRAGAVRLGGVQPAGAHGRRERLWRHLQAHQRRTQLSQAGRLVPIYATPTATPLLFERERVCV